MAVLGKLSYEIDLSGDASSELKNWNDKLREMTGTTKESARNVNNLEKEFSEMSKKTGLASKEVTNLTSKQGKLRGLSKSLGGFSNILKGAGLVAVGSQIGSFFTSAAQSANKFETTKVSFETMLGSAEKAKSVLDDLDKFSLKTPFTPEQVQSSAKSLIGLGLESDKIEESLKSIGDISSGTGKDFNELSSIYGKAMSSGVVQGEALNQLSEAGVPIIKEFAKQFGVSEQEIRKMASNGQIQFKHLDKAFKSMSSEGGQFANMMKKQSETGVGLLSTATGFIQEMQKQFGSAIMDMVKPVLKSLMPALKSIVEFMKSERGMAIMKIMLPAIAFLVGTVMVAAVYQLAVSFGILNIAMLPITLKLLVIMALGTLLYAFIDDFLTFLDGGDSALSGFFELFTPIVDAIKDVWNFFFGNDAETTVTVKKQEEESKLQKRALGGPVEQGGSYLVGEEGPELFIPESRGEISPNSKTSQTINNANRNSSVSIQPIINIYGNQGGGTNNIREQVIDAFVRILPEVRMAVGLKEA